MRPEWRYRLIQVVEAFNACVPVGSEVRWLDRHVDRTGKPPKRTNTISGAFLTRELDLRRKGRRSALLICVRLLDVGTVRLREIAIEEDMP